MIAYPESFDRQFTVARCGVVTPPAGSQTAVLNDLEVVTIGRIPLRRVYAADGALLGGFLGFPVDYRRGAVIQEDIRLDAPAPSAAQLDAFVEDFVFGHSGSFLFILDQPTARRVYLDADGSLSAVYDAERKVCAATAGLLLDREAYDARFRRELHEFLNVRADGWFPAGLTAHVGISRLMCNHYLDLDEGRTHRHWPTGQIAITDDPDAAIRRINASIVDTVRALHAGGRLTTTLTAGNETRMILAACREIKDQLNFYTVDSVETRLDAKRAQELAKRFGLNHRLLPIRYATPEQAEQWHARAGHSIGGPNMLSFPTVEALASFDFVSGGLGGEIGRAFFWRPTDTEASQHSAHDIAVRFGMPISPEVVSAVEQWMATVPPVDGYLMMDLAYLELRMSCWAFAQAYATPDNYAIHPMISREAFAAMLSLPPDWRRTNRMIIRGIELAWPELLSLPINRYGDYRDVLRPLGRAMRNPNLVIKKLRKRFG
ncbi:MAG: hypothetical protein JNK30_15065 [Phenylobacterium sp.]|uniref:hypothetical protein n=1 Tax=Phenylobacterium sp. TaxID=1871053 RepID=UPI001A42FB98|nr:hypothetical protein [Phenylobacterium sp.]MBL8772702.1 hypothetical protein [Phenylobacterium sp.]